MDLLQDLELLLERKTDEELLTKCDDKIKKFNTENERTFTFENVFNKEQHNTLLRLLFGILNIDSIYHTFRLSCLSMLRLLSRDRNLVTSITNMEDCLANLTTFLTNIPPQIDDENFLCRIETLKCLCNWIYHSKDVRCYFSQKKVTKKMMEQMSDKTSEINDYLFYQIRIMFLMSALEAEERHNLIEYNAVQVLVHIIEKVNGITSQDESKFATYRNIICEVLKALFNITLELSNVASAKLVSDCSQLVSQLQIMLAYYNSDESDDVITHIAHLFVNLPKDSLHMLCLEVKTDNKLNTGVKEPMNHPITYQDHDMTSVVILLSALEERLKIKSYVTMKEKTLAVLTAFCYVCRINSLVRKYLRQELLPTLVTSDTRPEERTDTRGDIVRLMTTVDVPLKNMAADFIFVLCKENTTRLIRYTGYGNSAGYLASRGLMIPGMTHADGEYSEDELTDVEDDNLDVMTGATARPKQDVFADLTEEEKEAEAEKLMNMIDRLKDLNMIRPMKVNNQGKIIELHEDEDGISD